jgi:hypothetical protein
MKRKSQNWGAGPGPRSRVRGQTTVKRGWWERGWRGGLTDRGVALIPDFKRAIGESERLVGGTSKVRCPHAVEVREKQEKTRGLRRWWRRVRRCLPIDHVDDSENGQLWPPIFHCHLSTAVNKDNTT